MRPRTRNESTDHPINLLIELTQEYVFVSDGLSVPDIGTVFIFQRLSLIVFIVCCGFEFSFAFTPPNSIKVSSNAATHSLKRRLTLLIVEWLFG